MILQPFLTSYDPSDLPGGSVDPLGFDRGYTFLAEKILPGLTNVASRPRYFSALCAGAFLSDDPTPDNDRETPRDRYSRRLETVQRLERFWTLACALAAGQDQVLETSGIRGIRYVEAAIRRMGERGETSTAADFRLLSRQLPYGMVGIYGTVADNLGLIDRANLSVGTGLGLRLGEAFVEETEIPPTLRRASVDGGSVGVNLLRTWGARAHLAVTPTGAEGRTLREAFDASHVRSRMGALLIQHPWREGETELQRLRRIDRALAASGEHPDLAEALRTIVNFEDCFRLVLLVFQRLLWLCQEHQPYCVELAATGDDAALRDVLEQLRSAWVRLDEALNEAKTPAFLDGLERLTDVRAFVATAAASASCPELVERVLHRHREVQQAKLHGGRPKMPWLEITTGRVKPTLTAAQRIGGEPRGTEQMVPHPYRTAAADGFCAAGGAA